MDSQLNIIVVFEQPLLGSKRKAAIGKRGGNVNLLRSSRIDRKRLGSSSCEVGFALTLDIGIAIGYLGCIAIEIFTLIYIVSTSLDSRFLGIEFCNSLSHLGTTRVIVVLRLVGRNCRPQPSG